MSRSPVEVSFCYYFSLKKEIVKLGLHGEAWKWGGGERRGGDGIQTGGTLEQGLSSWRELPSIALTGDFSHLTPFTSVL